MSKPFYVCGIDASQRNTAVAWGTGPRPNQCHCKHYFSDNIGKSVAARMKRIDHNVGDLCTDLDEIRPKVILIEGYAFSGGSKEDEKTGKKHQAFSRLAHTGEHRGVLLNNLLEYTPFIYEVAIGTHKKFVTGNGRADKELIEKCLRAEGYDYPTDHHFDAIGFFRMALVACGLMDTSHKYEREAVDKVVGSDRAMLYELAQQPAF